MTLELAARHLLLAERAPYFVLNAIEQLVLSHVANAVAAVRAYTSALLPTFLLMPLTVLHADPAFAFAALHSIMDAKLPLMHHQFCVWQSFLAHWIKDAADVQIA